MRKTYNKYLIYGIMIGTNINIFIYAPPLGFISTYFIAVNLCLIIILIIQSIRHDLKDEYYNGF